MDNSKQIEKVKTIYGYFFSWKDDAITKQLKQYSAHTRNELSMLRSLIKKGENIIDIGAHIGTFSIPFAKFNRRHGKIFSFEANPDNYELLIMNIKENYLDKIIIPKHAIVSCKNSQGFEMLLPDNGNSGMYYFLPTLTPDGININVIDIDSWYKNLDSEIQISLIKIDVEGAELSVLESCKELIEKYKPILYIEINKPALNRHNSKIEDIENLLKVYGYNYFRNIGPRNSVNDSFEISKLDNIEQGGEFFDLLAVHPSDTRYPGKCINKFKLFASQIPSFLMGLKKRLLSARRFFEGSCGNGWLTLTSITKN